MTWSSCIPIMQNFFRVKTEKVMQIAESDRKSREKTQNGCTVIMQNFFMSRLGSEVKYSK